MASTELIQAVIRESIAKLKDRKLGFGHTQTRPQSYYLYLQNEYGKEEGQAKFARYVWDRAEQLNLIPYEAIIIEDQVDRSRLSQYELITKAAKTLLEQYFTERNRQQLEKVINLVDLYGLWVESLKRSGSPLPEELRVAIEVWAQGHLAGFWLEKKINLNDAVAILIKALKEQSQHYKFDQDLFLSWLIPQLAQAKINLLQSFTSEIKADEFRDYLKEQAKRILEKLDAPFGIYGLNAAEIADRTLLFVMQTEELVYSNNWHQIKQEALTIMRKQVEQAVFFYCQPRMDMRERWLSESDEEERVTDLSEEDARELEAARELNTRELRKREAFLRKFLQIC